MIAININTLGESNVLRKFLLKSPLAQQWRGFAPLRCLIDFRFYQNITRCFHWLRPAAIRQHGRPMVAGAEPAMRVSEGVPAAPCATHGGLGARGWARVRVIVTGIAP